MTLAHWVLFFVLISTSCQAVEMDISKLEIPHTRYVLDNGLTLLVHEDHKAPIVAVSVWYNVGSKNEVAGKTGFAHLFEHLMYQGSENYRDEFFKPFEDVGATSMNGTTWFDRTNYFENVPSTAVDLALWMESDRMGHLLGAIDETKLQNQIGVVQNEKRQWDNAPYNKAEYRILEGLFPEGHPYRWSTIGSMEDLSAASLEDVQAWFKQYYGAANTVLVLAGDITPEQARQKVEHYFGDIPAGPPLHRLNNYVPFKSTNTFEEMFDTVPQRRIYRNWAVPGRTTQYNEALDITAAILGEGKTSRLYQRLVYEEKLATDVKVTLEPHTLASVLSIVVTLQTEASEQKVNSILNEEMARYLSKGPDSEELETAQAKILANIIRGLERVGGFTGKAVLLAESELYAGDSNHYKTSLHRYVSADAESIQSIAASWLSQPFHQLLIKPFPNYTAASTGADRSQLPKVTQMPELTFPEAEHFTLDNGIEVILAERSAIPDVTLGVVFNSGFAADYFGFPMGTGAFTLRMLEEGSEDLSGVELQQKLDQLGAELSTVSQLDASLVEFKALKAALEDSLGLLADVLMQPAFRSEDIQRVQTLWLAQIEQEKARPTSLALRELPPLLYGNAHPYGAPLTGSGTAESIGKISQSVLRSFHQGWLRPDNAKILAVGDVSASELRSALNKTLGDWQVSGQRLSKSLPDVPASQTTRYFLINKPNAPQSLILAGKIVAPSTDSENLTFETANNIIGGKFTARLNMNLREDKGWSYGTGTFSRQSLGPRPWMIYAPVQTDKTIESIKEIQRELNEFASTKPATNVEFDTVIKSEIRQLPGSFETNDSILASLKDSVVLNREFNYPALLKDKYQSVTLDDVNRIARKNMSADNLIWLIVGDAEQVQNQLEQMGTVTVLGE